MKKFVEDFKKFLRRGNVIDLAVAVVIGAAFGRIVQSLVKDILTPIISLVIGKSGFENYKYVITPANEALGIQENAIAYGVFFQNIFDFLVIAFVVFIIIRLINRANDFALQKRLEQEKIEKEKVEEEAKKKAQEKKAQPSIESLLTDIKHLLEQKNK